MMAIVASLILFGAEPRPELPVVPDGWLQISYESYHGPEGAYHDRQSGAWVRYCICPSPGAEETGMPEWGLKQKGAIKAGTIGRMPYAEFRGAPLSSEFDLAVAYYYPVGRFLALFQAVAHTPEQEARVRQLLLGGSRVWERYYPDYQYLDRDAKDADHAVLPLGSDLATTLKLTGIPSNSKPLPTGGFALYQLFRTNDLRGSRWVWLEFTREQTLLKK